MRAYGEPPGNQMGLDLPGYGQGGLELMREARGWVSAHMAEWCWYKRLAHEECARGGKASPNYCLQATRREFRVEIPNAYAPCLARIAMEEDAALQFRLAKSKVDGYTEVRL